MQDLYKVTTRDEAIQQFEETELPACIDSFEQDGELDGPARREAWNNFTDSLCKEREITSYQYETWVHPACCGR